MLKQDETTVRFVMCYDVMEQAQERRYASQMVKSNGRPKNEDFVTKTKTNMGDIIRAGWKTAERGREVDGGLLRKLLSWAGETRFVGRGLRDAARLSADDGWTNDWWRTRTARRRWASVGVRGFCWTNPPGELLDVPHTASLGLDGDSQKLGGKLQDDTA